MDHDELQHHLSTAAEPEGTRTRELLGRCWPGGAHDRTERAALAWLRRWHPEKLGASLPACSCARGRCVLCN